MPTIKVNHLVKTYRTDKKEPGLIGSLKSFIKKKTVSVEAVKDVSFEIEKGELVGFIGPNGAGKTTTLKVLSGLLYPTSGQISILGYTPWERKRDYLKRMSLVMGQKNQLWWDLPAQETFQLNKEIYQVPSDSFNKTLNRLLDMLEFRHLMDIPVRKLSLGERMKAELIAALIHSPEVLFLDEPTIGLDVVMQERIRSFVKDFNQEFKSTIILTSHYMEDVKALCKRVIMINKGQIVFDGCLKDLVKKYTYHKTFEITLEKQVSRKELELIGEVKELNYPRAIIQVPKELAKQKAIEIYSHLPVEDLNIKEPDLADVVRAYFMASSTIKTLFPSGPNTAS
ncbi:MAG: ABC transporter ATP-binding protein [Candidatus Shapirobacteria bacterium]|jgi:ABC-2 type transport system ATP-binding protein